MAESQSNRLANESSPYLLQHAHNPVDWYPWGREALAKAATEDKPILLSIGYAACHWCHVMERESFEDEETAALMNEHFVSIKVDREERPDLDAIYMDAVQAMTGAGGWPLTAFLTPEGRPFYAGTYYPPEPSHGMPSFRQVLTGIAEAWRDRREEVLAQGSRVVEAIAHASRAPASREPLSDDVVHDAVAELRRSFDERWGGFGRAPKFPQSMTLEFLLRQAVRGVPDALAMVTATLDHMADGGIYDHVGGGFARYSTDEAWRVPHFEKMLYDNALLARLYTRAWLVTRADRYRNVATETLDYLLRDMRHADGGFFSSQDADSEGIEGAFYTWTWQQLEDAIGPKDAAALGGTREGNWDGTNVLWRPSPDDVAAVEGEQTLTDELKAALEALFEIRERRIRPSTDDKVLTGWNALTISALAEAGRAFGVPRYVDAAIRCAEFPVERLRDDRGRTLRSWRGGTAGGPGYCDDHALLAEESLMLYETTFDPRWFGEAVALARELLRLFLDEEHGGFFTVGVDAEPVVVRPKELYDNAVPSGNSVAADVLQRITLLTGETEFERAGVSALRLVRDVMASAPTGFGHALCALDLYLGPSREVAIVGDPSADGTRVMVAEVRERRFLPNVVLAVGAPDQAGAATSVPLLVDRVAIGGNPTAYVCERFVCKLPVTDSGELARQLDERWT